MLSVAIVNVDNLLTIYSFSNFSDIGLLLYIFDTIIRVTITLNRVFWNFFTYGRGR